MCFKLRKAIQYNTKQGKSGSKVILTLKLCVLSSMCLIYHVMLSSMIPLLLSSAVCCTVYAFFSSPWAIVSTIQDGSLHEKTKWKQDCKKKLSASTECVSYQSGFSHLCYSPVIIIQHLQRHGKHVCCCKVSIMCGSRQYPYSPNGRCYWRFQRGRGSLKWNF